MCDRCGDESCCGGDCVKNRKAMASNFRKQGSEKFSQSTNSKVLSRDELKRRQSENSLKWQNPDGAEYAQPNKPKPAIDRPGNPHLRKQVSFGYELARDTSAYDVPPRRDGDTLVRVTTQHTTMRRDPASETERTDNLTAPRRTIAGVPPPEMQIASSDTGTLDTDVDVYEDEFGGVRGAVHLATLRQTCVPRIKVRVVCLIDVSGSMLLKGDKLKSRSKIAIMKNMAVDIIDALDDDEDFMGVMTFGNETRVVCPLTKVSSASRTNVKQIVRKLDEIEGFSAVTDLSSALLQAVDMLTAAQQDESLLYRNCIIVFSDGEVNAGKTEPRDLVHVVREKIRDCHMPRDILADLWVNVSCVTTGSNFSHALYLLSKMCGSDAYFFVDGNKSHPEAEMLIPLMLRKTACAQMVSINVRTSNGASLATQKCSQEYSVRRRGVLTSDKDSISYFLHDMPTGSQKTFTLALDIAKVRASNCDDFLFVDVQYVDSVGALHTVKKSLGLQQMVALKQDKERLLEVITMEGISELRQLLQTTCRHVANLLEDVPPEDNTDSDAVIWPIKDGQKELHRIKDEYARRFQGQGLGHLQTDRFDAFAKAIEDNISKLKQTVQQNSRNRERGWQYAKAMSSAVIRELPTVSNVLAQPRVVCPLPEAKGCESKRTQALSMYIFGGDTDAVGIYADRSAVFHSAVSDVAKTLADVLKMMEPSGSEA